MLLVSDDVLVLQRQRMRCERTHGHPLEALIAAGEARTGWQVHRAAIDDPREAVQLAPIKFPEKGFFSVPGRQQTFTLLCCFVFRFVFVTIIINVFMCFVFCFCFLSANLRTVDPAAI